MDETNLSIFMIDGPLLGECRSHGDKVRGVGGSKKAQREDDGCTS